MLKSCRSSLLGGHSIRGPHVHPSRSSARQPGCTVSRAHPLSSLPTQTLLPNPSFLSRFDSRAEFHFSCLGKRPSGTKCWGDFFLHLPPGRLWNQISSSWKSQTPINYRSHQSPELHKVRPRMEKHFLFWRKQKLKGRNYWLIGGASRMRPGAPKDLQGCRRCCSFHLNTCSFCSV